MTENSTATTQPPPAAPPQPPLRRSATNRMLGGVCGGLSEHTGIDVILFRVGFVVLTIAGGAGLLVYLALWLLLADAQGEPGAVQRWLSSGSSSKTRTAVLIVAMILVAAMFLGSIGADGGVIAVLAIAALAYLWVTDRDRPAKVAAAATGIEPATIDPVRPAAPRQRSILGRLTISVLLIALGILALLDQQTGFDLSLQGYLGAALAIVGLGLLVGTILGRSRGLIFLGIPLLALLIGVSTFDVSVRNGVGERYWQPQSVEEIDSSYDLSVGQARLDLSTVDFDDADVQTTVRQSLGYVRVIVPADVDVRVVSEVRTGEVTLFGVSTEAATELRREVTDFGPDGRGGGELELTVLLGAGLVEVIRAR